jgi:DNA-directed RNA polymerase specialized sigma24 family protein
VKLSTAFTEFMADAEPRLRRALVARYGMQLGRDATLDAMVYGWRHWDRVSAMANPVGYLYRVGTSSVRPQKEPPPLREVSDQHEPWIEPELEASLDALTEQQRVVVVLRHSFEWTYEEIAEFLDVSVSSVRTQLARGMEKLRTALEVSVDG